VFLCLLAFARAKKVRRLPGATGTTVMDGKALSLQDYLRLQNEGASQANIFISLSEKT